MQHQTRAFTLIELIISIAISMILMVSIGVFITSGMKHITVQKNILQNHGDTQEFISEVEDIFQRENLVFATGSASWFLLQSDGIYGEGGFVMFTPVTQTGFCLSNPDLQTTHLMRGEFFPFEWKDTDLFSWGWNIQNFASEINFGLNAIPAWYIADFSGIHFSDTKNHQIYRVQDQDKKSAFGKWVFGNDMRSLNTPTGIASSTTSFYVSDTWNNRILEFGSNFSGVKILLDEKAVSKPTGLYFTGNTLYVVESEKWRVMKYSSSSFSTPPTLNVEFTSEANQSLTGMTLKILSQTGWNIALTQTGTHSYGWTGIILLWKAQYEFPQKDYGIGQKYNFNISWLQWDFSATGSYIAEITLGTQKIVVPYFTQWDDSLQTAWDNTLSVFATGLTFPTGIYASGSDIVVNDFLTRQKVIFDTSGTKKWTENMANFDFSKIILNPNISHISEFAIEPNSFEYKKVGNMLHVSFEYYSSFDCENQNNNVKKSMIIKKELE